MKKILLFLLLIAGTQLAEAQQDTLMVQKRLKNLIKVNLTAIPLNNYSVTYERAIGKKISFGIGARYMPDDGLPYLSQIKKVIDDEDVNRQLDNLTLGNYAITPEVKFYFGKDVFRGFYIAPFARFAVYSASIPYEFDVDNQTETIPLEGDIKTITGGLQFGAQWKLSKHIYLDWFILGPHFGTSSGKISGRRDLSTQEQDALREELQDLEDADIPLLKIKTSVDDKGAQADFEGPWGGIKAGISLGFRF